LSLVDVVIQILDEAVVQLHLRHPLRGTCLKQLRLRPGASIAIVAAVFQLDIDGQRLATLFFCFVLKLLAYEPIDRGRKNGGDRFRG
jgi:hypothetical protein